MSESLQNSNNVESAQEVDFRTRKRFQVIVEKLGKELFKFSEQREFSVVREKKYTPESLIESFFLADPTNNKKYTQWLIKTYMVGGFLLEDLEKANDTLEKFIKYSPRLPEDKRDVLKYNKLGDVWTSIEKFVPSEDSDDDNLGSRERKRKEQMEAYEESDILVNAGGETLNGLKIAIPRTVNSAQWWGKGTRWCTAAEKNNYFDHYTKDAPLIVVVLPQNIKLQLWFNGNNNIQFMNAADTRVEAEVIGQHWDYLKPLIMSCSKFNSELLFYVPEDKRDEDWYIGLIKKSNKYRQNINSLDVNKITVNIIKELFMRDFEFIKHLPQDHQKKAIEILVNSKEGVAFLSEDKNRIQRFSCDLTPFLDKLIKRVPGIVSTLSESYLTQEIILRDIESRKLFKIKDVSEKFHNHEVLLALFKNNPQFDMSRHPEVVSNFNDALRFHYAISFQSNDFFEMCYPEIVESVKKNIDKKFINENIELNGDLVTILSLKGVSNELLMKAIQNTAKGSNVTDLLLFAKDRLTSEMINVFLEKNAELTLQVLKEKKIPLPADVDLKLAVKNSGAALKNIPEELITQELCNLAIRQMADESAIAYDNPLKYIPEKFKTPELCLFALEHKTSSLKFFPKEYLTHEICHETLYKDMNAIKFTPWELQSAEMVEYAGTKNVWNLAYSNPELLTPDILSRICENLRACPDLELSIELKENDLKSSVVARDIPDYNKQILKNVIKTPEDYVKVMTGVFKGARKGDALEKLIDIYSPTIEEIQRKQLKHTAKNEAIKENIKNQYNEIILGHVDENSVSDNRKKRSL